MQTWDDGINVESVKAGCTRLSRAHCGTDSIRSMLPLIYVRVKTSPVLREASRTKGRGIGLSTTVVLKLRTSL